MSHIVRSRALWIGLIGVGALVAVGCTTAPADVPGTVMALLESVEHSGPLGWMGFIGLYGLITIAGLPASSMQMSAGFLWGHGWGFAVAVVLSNLWGFLGFLLARTWLRNQARQVVERSKALSALDTTVADRATTMVALLRVSPLAPYNLMNLALGTTAVRPRDYFIGSLIGGIVPMAFYTGIGASVSDLAAVWTGDVQSPGWARPVGLGVTLLATILVTWSVRGRLLAAESKREQTGVDLRP
ncbi:MAG: VTT domain-containing protein [Myxococcota bacterium]